MVVKGVKDGIEDLPDTILNISDVIDRGAATSPLLSNNIKVPHKLEGVFVVLLAFEDLVRHALEVAAEMSGTKVGLEDVEYKAKRTPTFLVPGGIHHNFMAISRWVLLE